MALAAPISALAMRPGCKELYFVTAPCNSTSKAARAVWYMECGNL